MLSVKKTFLVSVSPVNFTLLISILFITLLFSPLSHSKKSKNFSFIETKVTSPFQLTHPVMAINLLKNKGKELVVFSINDKGERWLIVYAVNNQNVYSENYRLLLPKDFYSFDISPWQAGQLQTLYFLSSEHLFTLNELTINKNIPFLKVHPISSIARGNNKQYITRGHFLLELNNDKNDDIFIEGFNEAYVLIKKNNRFISSSLPIKPHTIFTPNVMKYYTTKTYFEDVNNDNLKDVIYINNGQLIYFLQEDNASINPTPHTLKVKHPISSIEWFNQLDGDGEKLDQSNSSYRKVELIKDINNDNIIDMIVKFTQSKGVLNKTNDYEVYLGRNINNIVTFLEQPDSTIKAEGTLTNMQFVDMNNDNKDEILVTGFDIGLSQIISALLSGSIDQDIHVFYMDEKSNFNKKAKVTKETEINFSLSSGTSGSPVVKLLDVNGDKLHDLMLSEDDDTLKIYLGTHNKRLFTKRAEKYKTLLPKQGGMLTSSDLNNDGKDDILIKYGRSDAQALRNTFTILMSE